jgi:hypothetical protein
MAKLVDALVSGTSVGNNVQVRVLFWAPKCLQTLEIHVISGVIFYWIRVYFIGYYLA